MIILFNLHIVWRYGTASIVVSASEDSPSVICISLSLFDSVRRWNYFLISVILYYDLVLWST
jgi:hypothetical protein